MLHITRIKNFYNKSTMWSVQILLLFQPALYRRNVIYSKKSDGVRIPFFIPACHLATNFYTCGSWRSFCHRECRHWWCSSESPTDGSPRARGHSVTLPKTKYRTEIPNGKLQKYLKNIWRIS